MWTTRKLGEICEIINGSTPLKSNKRYWENGNINWFTIEDIRKNGRYIYETSQHVTDIALDETSLKIVPKNSILLCCTASVGEYAITKQPLSTNQQFNALVLKTDEILPEYLFHYSSTLKENLLSVSGKITIDFISIKKLKEIEIPYPPLPVQKQIVEKLDAAFAEIDKAMNATQKNIKNTEALFQRYLKELMTLDGLDNFCHSNNDNSCKDIAVSWIISKLGDLCNVTAGQSPEGKYYNEDGQGLPFYQGKKLFSDRFLLAPNVWTSKITKLAEFGDILMSVRAPVGTINITKDTICIGRGLAAIKCGNTINRDFLFYYLINIEKYLTGSSGAVFNSINKNQIENIPIPLPPLQVQKQMVEKLDAVQSETTKIVKALEDKVRNLNALKSSLLNQAFSGELTKEAA